MPELPEVEVVRRGLLAHAVGKSISQVNIYDERSIRRHLPGASDFRKRLSGAKITDVLRRGKYLWLVVSSVSGSEAVVCHLGMSGQILVRHHGIAVDRHERITFHLEDGGQLRFCDQRLFGGMFISAGALNPPTQIAHIARDPLDINFELNECATGIKRRSTGIKRALLDQSLISGIGNIYADEALWRARLHYARDCSLLPRDKIIDLIGHVRDVMNEALAVGGTSFDALYVDVEGNRGYFSRGLHVYGHAGDPCSRCSASIRRDRFMNRSSYLCPQCQRTPRKPRW